MTVISTFAVAGFPILFGDLLLTGSTVDGKMIAVPAQGEVQDFFGDSGWSISGLSQKVCLLSDSCAIAWSGSWLSAKVAICELRRRALAGPLSVDTILTYLEGEPDIKSHPASFIGLVHDGSGLHQFHFGAEELRTTSIGTAYVSGTGSCAIREFADMLSNIESAATGTLTAGNVAIARALSLGGILLQSEFFGKSSAFTLRNMFGGGYEIAYFSNGRIQKLPEVTYVIWEAQIDGPHLHVSHPLLIIKQAYVGDHLLIKSARIESSVVAPTPNLVDEQNHVITPLFDTSPPPDLQFLRSISLQSKLLCHCILAVRNNEIIGLYTRVQQYSSDSELTVTFEDSEGQLRFSIRHDTASEITQSLMRFRR
ncbi:hypothetical protein EV678_0123 [Azospira oryzae]|uniref:Uncharacterized protein n=1 Tax=Azospira oryzae TaxID=146939 RepID=A0ABY0IP58_9RHOO|nr:hypothetical protein [Azospira oryzae]RZT89342.1 hypothetical protein EV678_0123 [Azospira oryzae]